MSDTNEPKGDTNDENVENQPSISKNKSEEDKVSCHHLFRYMKGEDASNGDLSVSGTYSETSIQEVAYGRLKTSRPRRNNRRPGRINKRRRISTQRGRVWRTKTRQTQRKPSVISTKVKSSRDGSTACCCVYCGHKCCRTRYTKEPRMSRGTRKKRFVGKPKQLRKGRVTKMKRRNRFVKAYRTERVQAGSKSAMLSPLFINSSVNPNLKVQVDENKTYAEVTPEMIYESLRKLTTWRQNVATADFLAHIQRSYPVNPDLNELSLELKEKLRVACLAGIVEEISEDMWCLKSSLHNLTSNHVTLFWNAYGDTMSPLHKQRGIMIPD